MEAAKLKKPETAIEMVELCKALKIKIYDLGLRDMGGGKDDRAFVTGFRWTCEVCLNREETVSKVEEKALHIAVGKSDMQTNEGAIEFGRDFRLTRDLNHFQHVTLQTILNHQCKETSFVKMKALEKVHGFVHTDLGRQQLKDNQGVSKEHFCSLFSWRCKKCLDVCEGYSNVETELQEKLGMPGIVHYRCARDLAYILQSLVPAIQGHSCETKVA